MTQIRIKCVTKNNFSTFSLYFAKKKNAQRIKKRDYKKKLLHFIVKTKTTTTKG